MYGIKEFFCYNSMYCTVPTIRAPWSVVDSNLDFFLTSGDFGRFRREKMQSSTYCTSPWNTHTPGLQVALHVRAIRSWNASPSRTQPNLTRPPRVFPQCLPLGGLSPPWAGCDLRGPWARGSPFSLSSQNIAVSLTLIPGVQYQKNVGGLLALISDGCLSSTVRVCSGYHVGAGIQV